MDDDWEEGYEAIERRFRPLDVVVLMLSTAADVIEAVANNLHTATQLVAGHTNWEDARNQFHQEAAQTIEKMTGEE